MEESEAFSKIRQGVRSWNEWRNTPEVRSRKKRLDLSSIDLRGEKLSHVNFSGVILNGANLEGADLEGANFHFSIANDVNFSDTNLKMANFSSRVMGDYSWSQSSHGARLENSNFREARIVDADFTKADVKNAKFDGALFWNNVFVDCNLSGATGLETCMHIGPSTIDHLTLQVSGSLPLEFLRGCGLPDLLIDNYNSLQGNPIQLYSCFLSHSSKDSSFVRRLYADLQDNGVRCYYAPEHLKSGKKLHSQLFEAISLHDKLLLVLSKFSISSSWVESEIRRARRRERVESRQILFPIRLIDYNSLAEWELFDSEEGRDLAAEVRSYFIPDFSGWKDHDRYSESFEKLLSDLKKA